MKILSFIGSLRKDSFNRRVYNEYRRVVGDRAEFVEANFSELPPYNEDLHQSTFPDVVTRLADQVKMCDGILFFSPEYNYSIPGHMKNALDWLSRLKDLPLAGKPASVVGASIGRIGTARMQYHLRQVGVFLNLIFMNQPELMIGTVQDLIGKDGKIKDENILKMFDDHFSSFSEFVEAEQRTQEAA